LVDGNSTTGDEEPCVAPLLRGCRGLLLDPNQINGALRVSQTYVWGKIMIRLSRLAVVFVCALWAVQGGMAQAQWGFPGGFGGFCWGGWGVGTAEGDIARGMGLYAQGLGFYEKQTAVARSIDTDTVMRWNQFVHESQMNSNRLRQQRLAGARDRNARLTDEIQKRLRDNPDARDIHRGDALNAALDEIDDPRVYAKALQGAKVKIGGENIRQIPFRYASAAITFSIHELAKGTLPAALRGPEFEADREALEALDQQITEQIADGKDPDPATVEKLLAVIYAAEEKAAKIFPRNSRARNEADRYLKGLHGLAAMLKTSAIEVILAGVENRPDATLGELLNFMTAFNLRFGVASTPQQREIYSTLYPKLVQLRNEIAPALATSAAPKTSGTEAEDFFSVMSDKDLQKKAPKPQAAGGRPR
jgi:hypothetical protein